MNKVETPVLDKLLEIKPFADKIMEFLYVCESKNIHLWGLKGRTKKRLCGAEIGIMLNDFFGIDKTTAEQERTALLNSLRGD